MRIVNKKEMLEMPVGTVFVNYVPSMITGEVRIKTDYHKYNGNPTWNGELNISPFFKHDIDDENHCYTQWATVDTSEYDYDDDQLFAVFSKTEVLQMINCLQWALADCKFHLNQDIWHCDYNFTVHDNDIDDYASNY